MKCVVTFKRGGDTYLAEKGDKGYTILSAIRISRIAAHIKEQLPVHVSFEDANSMIRTIHHFKSDEEAMEYAALEAL